MCLSPSVLTDPLLVYPFRADRSVREMGPGHVQEHMGILAHGDSEGALFEEGTQTGGSDRTRASVAASLVGDVGGLAELEVTQMRAWGEVCKGSWCSQWGSTCCEALEARHRYRRILYFQRNRHMHSTSGGSW